MNASFLLVVAPPRAEKLPDQTRQLTTDLMSKQRHAMKAVVSAQASKTSASGAEKRRQFRKNVPD